MKNPGDIKILQITTIDMTTYCFHLPLLEFLKNKGFDVCAAFTQGKFTDFIRQKGIRVFNIPIARRINPVSDFISLLKLYKLIKKEKFDIVHTATSKAGFIGRLAAHLAKTPVIIHTVYELPQNSAKNPCLKLFYRVLERVSAKWADKLITISMPNANQILREKITSQDKLALIPNGIDIEKFNIKIDKSKKKKELGLESGFKVIGTVGRLEPVKGHKYLLEAAEYVIKRFPQAVFLIIGEGYLKDKLREAVKAKNIEKNVIMLGFREDLTEILHTLDIYVSASLWEGFGVAIAEAMACGLPVVTTGVGGTADFAADGVTALVVPPANPRALGNAITDLLGNPSKAASLGRNAREKIKNEFSEELMIEKSWVVYKEFIASL